MAHLGGVESVWCWIFLCNNTRRTDQYNVTWSFKVLDDLFLRLNNNIYSNIKIKWKTLFALKESLSWECRESLSLIWYPGIKYCQPRNGLYRLVGEGLCLMIHYKNNQIPHDPCYASQLGPTSCETSLTLALSYCMLFL